MKAGDSVVVKSGTKDPDLEIDIGGWQGRIVEIDKNQKTFLIEWDSHTLKHMPSEVIEQCEAMNWDWERMYLYQEDIDPADPRDNNEDRENISSHLNNKYSWAGLGEEGKRILNVLEKAKSGDDIDAFDAWERHLKEVLKLPFEAVVSEFQEKGPLQQGDKVKVHGFEAWDDLYGIIVSIRAGRRKYAVPLCDLEVIDRTSSNYQPVKDYAVWFANR